MPFVGFLPHAPHSVKKGGRGGRRPPHRRLGTWPAWRALANPPPPPLPPPLPCLPIVPLTQPPPLHHAPALLAEGYYPALFTEIAQNYVVPHRPGAIDTNVAKYLVGALLFCVNNSMTCCYFASSVAMGRSTSWVRGYISFFCHSVFSICNQGVFPNVAKYLMGAWLIGCSNQGHFFCLFTLHKPLRIGLRRGCAAAALIAPAPSPAHACPRAAH